MYCLGNNDQKKRLYMFRTDANIIGLTITVHTSNNVTFFFHFFLSMVD